jgi:hypothetical protein
MTITIPEYVVLFCIGVANIWAAVILAGIRARTAQEDNRPLPIPQPARMDKPRAAAKPAPGLSPAGESA